MQQARTSSSEWARCARRALVFGVSALLLATVSSVDVLAQFKGSDEDLRQLPRVCLAQPTIHRSLAVPVVPDAERKMWAEIMGPVYKHLHHYCWALAQMRQASRTTGKDQAYYYRTAISNFEYVERHADASFPLFPELLLRKGMALRLVNQDSDAAHAFSHAIRVKSDYSPAYAALIDLYVDLKDEEGARRVLEQGLQRAPNSKILMNKKRELDSAETDSSP